MARHELLNNIRHKDLHIKEDYSVDYGKTNVALTFPTEFVDVQREYPILFRKNVETGEFQSVVLFGIEPGENLFIAEDRWDAHYIPAIVARGPFLIGFKRQTSEGVEYAEPVVHVDMDDPRVNQQQGQRVFMPHGGNSDYIQRISTQLRAVHEGIELNKKFAECMSLFELFAPVTLEIELSHTDKYTLTGFYTVNAKKLATLEAAAVLELHACGFLQGAYFVCASLGNIQKLIDIKKARALSRATIR